MKTLLLIAPFVALTSCASLQNNPADLNGDGLVSDAEFKQSGKSNYSQRDNVLTERVKRDNAVDAVGDVRRTAGNVLGFRNILRAF